MSAVVELTLRPAQGQPRQWRIPVASEQSAGKVVAQIMLLLAIEPDGSQNQKANKTRRVYQALTALADPAGWANTQIKRGYWPPPLAPSLLSSSDLTLLSSGQSDDETIVEISQEDELWSQILSHLQWQMSRATFETWLKDTQLTVRDGSKFTVAVKNAFGRDWLEHRLRMPIRRVIAQLIGVAPEQVELSFVVK